MNGDGCIKDGRANPKGKKLNNLKIKNNNQGGCLMAENKTDNQYKNFLMYLSTIFVLILGITLILVWWADVVSLFKGFTGLGLALGAMIMLYVLNNK